MVFIKLFNKSNLKDPSGTFAHSHYFVITQNAFCKFEILLCCHTSPRQCCKLFVSSPIYLLITFYGDTSNTLIGLSLFSLMSPFLFFVFFSILIQ